MNKQQAARRVALSAYIILDSELEFYAGLYPERCSDADMLRIKKASSALLSGLAWKAGPEFIRWMEGLKARLASIDEADR